MSLDNIQLPGFIIQDLFQKNLVDLSQNYAEEIKSEEKTVQFFGGNKQHIIILVDTADAVFVSDEQLTFLSGILNACKLNLEDVGIINMHNYRDVSYKIIHENFTPRIVIMFGVTPESVELPFVIPYFQKQTFNNQIYLSAPALTVLESDKDLKRKLWTALQQIFSI